MMRTSVADFLRNFSATTDEALTEPIVVTRNGRDRLVLSNVSDFSRLIEWAKQADLSQRDLQRLNAVSELLASGRR